jgi:hypothetical protein
MGEHFDTLRWIRLPFAHFSLSNIPMQNFCSVPSLVKSRETYPICGGRTWYPPALGTYDFSPPQKEST